MEDSSTIPHPLLSHTHTHTHKRTHTETQTDTHTHTLDTIYTQIQRHIAFIGKSLM